MATPSHVEVAHNVGGAEPKPSLQLLSGKVGIETRFDHLSLPCLQVGHRSVVARHQDEPVTGQVVY